MGTENQRKPTGGEENVRGQGEGGREGGKEGGRVRLGGWKEERREGEMDRPEDFIPRIKKNNR